jgi:hypothetical protein
MLEALTGSDHYKEIDVIAKGGAYCSRKSPNNFALRGRNENGVFLS